MPAGPRKQRLFRLLRQGKGPHPTESPGPEMTAVWSAHERAVVRTRDAGAAAQRIASSAARQRTSIDSVADGVRNLSSRTGDLQAGFGRVLDAFERLSLVALNAGLEGARLGETEGRQLGLVSDEVRAHSLRGAELSRELASAVAQLAAELGQLDSHVAQAQNVVSEVTQDSARALGAAGDAESALVDIGERLKKATGSDPETVRAVAEATERARAFVAALNAVSGKVPRALLVAAVRPALEPLTRLLLDEQAHNGDRD
jgi:methyl-accepting chemotaxis protein